MSAGSRLLDYLYPPNARCVGCGDLSGADRDGFCGACLSDLEAVRAGSDAGCCPRCMQPLDGRGQCGRCELMAGRIGEAAFAFFYRGSAAATVRAFKYAGLSNLSGWMARQMLGAPRARKLLDACDLIVCAPMDPFRRNWRGYNQAWLLARSLSELTGIPARDVLRRRAFVRRQATLNREQRLRNLDGIIRCREDVRGRRVLLVDDVRTTGSTAVGCAQALLDAGAVCVNLLTFAGTV